MHDTYNPDNFRMLCWQLIHKVFRQLYISTFCLTYLLDTVTFALLVDTVVKYVLSTMAE